MILRFVQQELIRLVQLRVCLPRIVVGASMHRVGSHGFIPALRLPLLRTGEA
jgi:hypothetical protein